MCRDNKNPMVSVIMPVYNGELFCQRAINSVLNQTYKQIELIVINDGSNDGTAEIVNKLIGFDDRLRLINQTNGGVSSARNRGIQEAKGEFLAFIDADDCMSKTFIEKMLSSILKEDTDVAICGYRNVYSDGHKTERYPVEGKSTKETLEKIMSSNMINLIWNKMYKRNLITHLFNTEKLMGEDLEFNIDYFETINSISVVNDALYEYTQDSIGSLTKNDKLVWRAIVDDWNCLNRLKKKGIDKKVIDTKMFAYVLYIIEKQEKRAGVKRLLKMVNQDTLLKSFINNGSYKSIKYNIAKVLINQQSFNTLFFFFMLKKNFKNLIKRSI